MASEFAVPPSQVPQQDEMDSSFQQSSSSFEEPKTNGIHDSATSSMQPSDLATAGKLSIPEDQGHLPVQEAEVVVPDPNPSAPSPIDQIDSGIAPLADFIPKDGLNNSHPTPPPDEPLVTGTADVDIEMAETGPESEITPSLDTRSPPPPPVPSEPSLVRPREDDDEDVPAAKRSKVDDAPVDVVFAETEVIDPPAVEEAAVVDTTAAPVSALEPAAEPVVEEIITEVEAPSVDASVAAPVVEPAVDSAIEAVVEDAVDPVVEETVAQVAEPPVESTLEESAALLTDPVPESVAATVVAPDGDIAMQESTVVDQTSDVAALPLESTSAVAALSETPMVETPVDEKPMLPPAIPVGPVQAEAGIETATAAEPAKYSTEPMTGPQKAALLEKTKNLKKTRASSAFLRPVDYIALNIPGYPEMIKQPMDLSTMESKLKGGEYASVQDYANDFDLIISNARRFNGDQHAVTQAGFSMQAYFNKMMQGIPSADEKAAPKVEKKRSPSLPRAEKPRRESRAVAQPAAPAAAPASTDPAQTEQFALVDGTPQIRRQSSINRPARAIKPTQNREIPYPKPKRKEHQLELRFCEHMLDQLRSARFSNANQIFGQPVDPVALNIPHYRQIIKTPMDLSTMSQKLRNGQYSTAAEFRKDFDLMIKNCLTFNPVGNPVRDLGIQFQRDFETLWQEKDKWERKNQPPSNRASSASGDEESVADDEEDEEVDDEDDKSATIRALQKQLAQMQNALSGLGGSDKQSKSKKAKTAQSSSKKSGGSSKAAVPSKKAAPKPAAKPKKPRLVTYEEKQEISEAVGNMTDQQLGRVTEIITQHDPKYRDMEEMELEIDELTTEVQNMLLDYVRKVFGNPNKKKAREASPDDAAALDDDDYEERGGGARGGKRKKHRPMGKKEQQDTISAIQEKLSAFKNQTGTSGSESPTNSSFVAAKAEADSSGDEESEESEEE